MEDYILKEIDKIGKLIEAMLSKLGVSVGSRRQETVYEVSRTELLEKLDLDIDTLLEQENLADTLVREHGFSNSNLDKFAELLFEFLLSAEDETFRRKLAANIGAIYGYLEKHENTISFNKLHILREMKKYV